MAEKVYTRVKRIISANIEDLVDRMERAGGTSVMRESIREVERAIDDVRNERDAATVRRLQAVRQQKLYQERLDALTEKAQYALDQGREDLAEAALSRQVDFEAQIAHIQSVETEAGEEERLLEEAMASLEVRGERMKEELKVFEMSRVEVGLDKDSGVSDALKRERRMDRAEAAFDRAMGGAGGESYLSDSAVQDYKSLAELDQMQRSQKIADRLSALKEQRKAS